MSHPSIELRARQSLVLTPRLQQSVRLLQLSALEFQQELRAALSNNPFLESEESAADEASQETEEPQLAPPSELALESSGSVEEAPAAPLEAAYEYDTGRQEESFADGGSFADTPSFTSTSSGNQFNDDFDPTDWVHVEPSLRQHLTEELRLYPLADRERMVAQLVIESLDDDGYLRQELEELLPLVDLEPPLKLTEIATALKLVQNMDAPGLAARSLAECLTLQLERLPEQTPGREIAIALTRDHLDGLARREHAELQKKLKCSADELRTASLLVRSLDPRPGDHYGSAENNYLVPDVIVHQIKGKWAVAINPAVLPKARLHRRYAELFAQSRGPSGSPLAQQLQEARWLIRNAQQRFATIQQVAECIVAHQKAFFDYGEIALKPMVLRDVADELGLHESTVSRATGNKYMATPRGIFEFKRFFPRELSTASGGTCSAAAVRALLKEMIEGEDAQDPLSDVTLARLLSEQGVQIARRTVTKYRQAMKVAPAEMRRRDH